MRQRDYFQDLFWYFEKALNEVKAGAPQLSFNTLR